MQVHVQVQVQVWVQVKFKDRATQGQSNQPQNATTTTTSEFLVRVIGVSARSRLLPKKGLRISNYEMRHEIEDFDKDYKKKSGCYCRV